MIIDLLFWALFGAKREFALLFWRTFFRLLPPVSFFSRKTKLVVVKGYLKLIGARAKGARVGNFRFSGIMARGLWL